ncbi:MAG TPA: DEAD/DEAH box helicase [Baekduia sp.]|nr:DEAD/DEAH box helicase [Baekduia sp.]
MSLEVFSPAVREWFERAFEGPTPAQELAWPAIASGEHTLLSAPTGSGKTLAAFLWGLDSLSREQKGQRGGLRSRAAGSRERPPSTNSGVKLIYVSPLKALGYDIERNLRAPLRGIGLNDISVGIRTGDTPQKERMAMRRNPPDILITTPESLYLMLTSQAAEILQDVETVIVDEIHAVAATKRGAHMSLTLERLTELAGEYQRVGLSATQNPLEEVGRFLVGPTRKCRVIDAKSPKRMDIKIHVPVESMIEPEQGSSDPLDPLEPIQGGEATRRSIWPVIYPELLRLVQEHKSTIIFVNARRQAERLALRLNGLANADVPEGGEHVEIARSHHGSMAREERHIVEELLKAGQLPCLVATSSLELGIDMGAVDLVLMVESPKSVASGLQRVGRAGHGVGETSKGRVFPKFRADLLECAVVVKGMREGRIESTVVPRNPLDVLCQQIVAIAATSGEEEGVAVDALEALVKRSYNFAELPRELLENVLDMLDGRYPSQEFAELRPRIVWDRVAGTIRPRKGARGLAITNAGTIPDRGLFQVTLPDGRKVGEFDEEMVYEARPGQVFTLGASTWRIEEIGRDRVIVTPAPGAPGALPFWRGDGVGRPLELGRALGEFSRWAVDQSPATLSADYDLDELAAKNLVDYLTEQQEATRVVPSDQMIVVERFRDEIGDWRLCILSPYGGRVHAAWGLALSAKIRDELGIESDAIWADDGIIVHLPDTDDPPGADFALIEPDQLEDLVVGELSGSALFGARFRENAARALLIPRAYPGKRTPLWQQRLKSQSLLEVAKRYGDFPIILETYRECLREVLDVDGLQTILRGLHSRELSLVEVETKTASPFASSLLFDYVAKYMYEGDTPNAERRAAALSLDRDLLRELLGQEELRDLIDADALDQVEADLQHVSERTRAASRDELADVLRRVGDLNEDEVARRVHEGGPAMLEELESERRVVQVRVGGELRWIAADDAGLYRDAFGVVPPGGLPEPFLEQIEDPIRRVMARYARTHGPFTTAEVRARYGVDPTSALKELEADGVLVRGELRPSGTEREWCDADVLRRLRRASLAVLRKEIEAADPRALAAFLPSWHGIDRHSPAGAGVDRLREALVALQGVALPADVWERDVLPRRIGAYSPTWMDQLCASGEVVWVGAGALGRNSGRVALYFREDADAIGPPPVKGEVPASPIHDQLRELLQTPRFFSDLIVGITDASAEEIADALWDLAWAGEATNDAFAPLRAPRLTVARNALKDAHRGNRSGTRFQRRRSGSQPQVQGRWGLVRFGVSDPRERRRNQAELLLERHGIVTREQVLAEGIPGGFSALYDVLADLETLGVCRRGYFVEGLGGAQFALPGAVERLRSFNGAVSEEAPPVVLAATDPAQPYGAALKWPERESVDGARHPAKTPARAAGAYVVLAGAEPAFYVERGGKSLQPLIDIDDPRVLPALRALAAFITGDRKRKLAIERVDGESVIGSPWERLLIDVGFSQGPRKVTLRA